MWNIFLKNKHGYNKIVVSVLLMFIICFFTACSENVSLEITPTFNFDKTYPKVFKAWNEAENFEGFSDVEKMAAYDLIFDCTYLMGTVWKISEEQPYASLSTELVDAESWEDDLSRSIAYKEDILELNENFKVLAQVYIREESYVTEEEIASGLPIWEYEGFPLESEFWLLDEEGKHIPGWGEDLDADGVLEEEEVETYLIDFTNERYQDLVVAKVVALYESQALGYGEK